MSDDTTTPVEKALKEFSVDSWLEDSTQAQDTIELYNNGRLVKALLELTEFIEKQADKRQQEEQQLLRMPGSIDEDNGVSQEVLEEIESLREQLHGTGLTFHLTGITPIERDILDKKTQRSLKPVKPTEDSPAIPGGAEHPDYRNKWTDTLVAACISKVVSPDGSEDTTKWTPARVEKLRNLPGVEFMRLSNAVFGVVFMSYEIEKLIDLDFS